MGSMHPRRLLELTSSRGAAVQLTVLHRGEVLVDGSVGCAPEALGWLFSASKPFTSLLVHRLARRGVLDLDDPVARHWPEFAAAGKADTTIREVLTHRTAVPTAGPYVRAVLSMQHAEASMRRVARGRRRSGRYEGVSAYQALDFGFILGAVVQRSVAAADGGSAGSVGSAGSAGLEGWARLLRRLVLDPAGLQDVHPGVPDDQLHRCLPFDGSLRAAPGGPVLAALGNRRSVRQARLPAAGISTTSRELARFYQSLLRAPELEALTTPSSAGERDAWTRLPTRWGTGVQLGGSGPWCPFGQTSTERTFGHNGSDVCLGWADPDLDLAVGLVTDRASGRRADKALLVRLSDEVRRAALARR